MKATKRIPVTPETWKELGRIKEAGQTYDHLLTKLIQAMNRLDLADRFRRMQKKNVSELTPAHKI